MISVEDENKQIATQFIELLNSRKFEELSNFIHKEFRFFPEGIEYYDYYREIAPDVPDFEITKDGWLNRLKYEQTSFTDLKRIILKIMAEDDEVWVWTKRRGKHTTDFDGFPASNREIDIYSFVRYQIKDGQIYRSFNLDDDLRGFIQIGKLILEENDEAKVGQYMSQLRRIGLIK
ncbi:MAG: ester cyclase [Candidatus Heimdallarchaeota archaeon]|nr:ester cyclase [Candidatus Heimdallarchaeota archaeon]